jgi:roadblock/LC7 domain-containing protein
MDKLLKYLIIDGVQRAGTYNPEDVLLHIEENLTLKQYQLAEKFLQWVHDNGKKFGHGTIDARFSEFALDNTAQ